MPDFDTIGAALGLPDISDVIPEDVEDVVEVDVASEVPAVVEEVVVEENLPAVIDETDNEQTEQDLSDARRVIRKAMDAGEDVIDDLVYLVKASEHPKMYDSLASMINAMTRASHGLLEVRKTKDDIEHGKGPEETGQQQITVQKAVFVGSTAELQQQIKEARDGS